MKNIEKNSSNYIPNTSAQKTEMLKEIGKTSFEHLIDFIPQEIKSKNDLNIPGRISESELFEKIYKISKKNLNFVDYKPLVGGGAYRHYIPEVVKTVLAHSEFYTSYTPYQAEVSQGTLQTMFEVQTHLSRLTGMDVVVPSIYDGASATAEAILMSLRIKKKRKVIISSLLHPHYKETINTYLEPHEVEIIEVPYKETLLDIKEVNKYLDNDTACILIQNPNFLGGLENIESITTMAHKKDALVLVTVIESLSLALLKSLKSFDVDIVAGETQSFGMDLNFGGPYNGFVSARDIYLRQMPGRIVAETTDQEGKRAFVMALRAREQDIKREKATSNICSNHALNLFAIDAYLSLLGKKGLYRLAVLNAKSAHYLRKKLIETGKFSGNEYSFFNEFILRSKENPENVRNKLLESGFLPPLDLSHFFPELQDNLLFAVTELFSKDDLNKVIDLIGS